MGEAKARGTREERVAGAQGREARKMAESIKRAQEAGKYPHHVLELAALRQLQDKFFEYREAYDAMSDSMAEGWQGTEAQREELVQEQVVAWLGLRRAADVADAFRLERVAMAEAAEAAPGNSIILPS